MINYDLKKVKLVVADLDGTLSKSKTPMDQEMAKLICNMLKNLSLAVISGGSYNQFQKQFVSTLAKVNSDFSHLYLFPTCATSMYMIKNGNWENVYNYKMPEEAKKQIIFAFEKALNEYGFKRPENLFGELIEDRETQITFSAYGQLAPLELKQTWDPDGKIRTKIIEYLSNYLPKGYEAKFGGTTSIDVTKEGVDKAYGIKKIEEKLGYKINEMLFVGDRLYEGGNDYPVKSVGVECIAVKDPEETKNIFKELIKASTQN